MAGQGRSSTSLSRRLGLRAGQAVAFVRLPESLDHLKEAAVFRRIELAPDWRALPEGTRDVIQVFTTSSSELAAALPVLRDLIGPEGALWVCWPKRASPLPTDLGKDVIRALASSDIWVEERTCVLDAVWSGLKLALRVESRGSHVNNGVAA
ncbi:DUF3052 domain-containing protein [bacterium]|nr:DUF3052 domain-containing protein [bacterium]